MSLFTKTKLVLPSRSHCQENKIVINFRKNSDEQIRKVHSKLQNRFYPVLLTS